MFYAWTVGMKVRDPNPLISVRILSFEIQLLSHGMGVGGRNCISLWGEIKNCIPCYEILIMLLKSGTKLSSLLFPDQLYQSMLYLPLLPASLCYCLYFLAFLFPLQEVKCVYLLPRSLTCSMNRRKERIPLPVFFTSHFFPRFIDLLMLFMGFL